MKYVNVANFEEGMPNEETLRKKKKKGIIKKAAIAGAAAYTGARMTKKAAIANKKRKNIVGSASRQYLGAYGAVKKGVRKGAKAAGKPYARLNKKMKNG